MEKITAINELVSRYKKAGTTIQKEAILKSIAERRYIPYSNKMAFMQGIVNDVMMDINGKIRFNSPMKFVLFTCMMLSMYTCINVDPDNLLSEFDTLNKDGLVDILINPKNEKDAVIPTKEISECNVILNMLMDDFMTNRYETHAFIENQVERVTDVLGVFLQPLADKLSSMDEKDMVKLSKNIERLFKVTK